MAAQDITTHIPLSASYLKVTLSHFHPHWGYKQFHVVLSFPFHDFMFTNTQQEDTCGLLAVLMWGST